MQTKRRWCTGWIVLMGIGWILSSGWGNCDDDPASGLEEQVQTINPIQESKFWQPFKFGVDYYWGTSNVAGKRRFNDGMWAGFGSAYPSTSYIRWENDKGFAAKFSAGLGDMYLNSGGLLDQPVEAWWQFPLGNKVSVTVGKYWVPFAFQEWQYETKPGIMFQVADGAYSLAASLNYNQNTRRANTYVRAGYSFGDENGFGASWGRGRGLSYDTAHDSAWGVDGTVSWNGFRATGEYVKCLQGSNDFDFVYGKLSYEKFGAWRPFVASYAWNDEAGSFGRYRSMVYGLGYQITPQLTLEGAYASTSDKGTWWVQLHWYWER